MKNRLLQHHETPQAVALNNQTINMEKFLQNETDESIFIILDQLQKNNVVSQSESMQLKQVFQQEDTDKFVSDLIICLSQKEMGKVVQFLDVLEKSSKTLALGSHLKMVLHYCTDVLDGNNQMSILKKKKQQKFGNASSKTI